MPSQRPFHGTAVYYCVPCIKGYPTCYNVFDVQITVTELQRLPSVTIMGVYRAPSVPVRRLCKALRHLHVNILCSKQFQIVIGDFNVNWLNKQQISGLYNLMDSEYPYCQVVNKYTTCSESVIDHIYINIGEDYLSAGVLETYSDHKAVWIGVNRELCE